MVDAYKSVLEMPKFRELDAQLKGLRLFSLLLPKKQRRELAKTRKDFYALVDFAECFYQKLGNRHWVLHESLKTDEIENDILSFPPEEAEKTLIHHYQSEKNLDRYILHLKQHEALLARWDQIQRAKEDYLSGRFDSATLMLIAILDGFVNDVDKQERRGLHTRDPKEMVGFDCLGGHHLGLSNVIPTFQKSFHKRHDEEVYEVYRNGIVHGCITRFNNATIASKAWNYLFAVSDWANNRGEPEKQALPSLKELLEQRAALQVHQQKIQGWQPYTEAGTEAPFSTSPMKEQTDFFGYWEKEQIGLMLRYMFRYDEKKDKASYINFIKEFYIPIKLTGWQVIKCEHQAPAVAIVAASIQTSTASYAINFRWIHVDDSNTPRAEWENGKWVLAPNVPQELWNVITIEKEHARKED